jgi:NMD protein affecting ribosome stability and mRNA decay
MNHQNRLWTGERYISLRSATLLTILYEAHERGDVFVTLFLDTDQKRCMRWMVKQDWVFESPGLDGVRYTITGRGQRIVEQIRQVKRYRRDNLCPRCGQDERKRESAYCNVCANEKQRMRYASGGRERDKLRRMRQCAEKHGLQNVGYRKGHAHDDATGY